MFFFSRKMSNDQPPPRSPKPGSSPGQASSRHGTKKVKKDKPDQQGTRPEHRHKKDKKDGKTHDKLPKTKKPSKKKALNLYAYNELVVHSSEDDLYGYKDEQDQELDADLGWDPTTYYPLSYKARELTSLIPRDRPEYDTSDLTYPIQTNRAIELRELSSPAVLGQSNDDEELYCEYTGG